MIESKLDSWQVEVMTGIWLAEYEELKFSHLTNFDIQTFISAWPKLL